MKKSCLIAFLAVLAAGSLVAADNNPPEGFTALFNGKDLSGWWGLGTEHYNKYMNLAPEALEARKEKSREDIKQHWRVEDGVLINDGHGLYLTTDKFYGDFEFHVEYKTVPKADSGIYLRGCPQVQIWDYTEKGKFKLGADKGSGGLWNNAKGSKGKDPLVLADKPFGEWNSVKVTMVGDYVTVVLNDKLVVDKCKLQNYFDRKNPVPAEGPIQLQTHGGKIEWKNVYVREIGPEEADEYLMKMHTAEGGYESIFNGKDFAGWTVPDKKNKVVDGAIHSCAGHMWYEKELSNFSVVFEYYMPKGGNNGLAIRYPGKGNTAYDGMCELQILDNESPKYSKLKPHQYHGSIYGMVPAKRGYVREPENWNFEKVTVNGARITVEVNGYVITDADVTQIKDGTTMYPLEKFKGRLREKGFFGFAGHGAPIRYRNIKLKEL